MATRDLLPAASSSFMAQSLLGATRGTGVKFLITHLIFYKRYFVAHLGYMYSFRIYMGCRKEFKCKCDTLIQRSTSDLDIPPWWYDGSSNVNWPKKLNAVVYKRVHLFNNEVGPWCTYVLIHDCMVAASNLTVKDLEKFQYRKAHNELVLGKDFKSKMKTKEHLELREKIQHFLSNVHSVVPKHSLENCLSEVKSNDVLEQMIVDVPSSSSSFTGEAVQFLIQAAVKLAVHHVTEEVSRHMKTSEMIVSKEIQKNDWIISSLKHELESWGFIVNYFYSQSDFCLFGKSLPDFYFYKEGEEVQGVMVATLQDNNGDGNMEVEDENVPIHLIGSTTEFKVEYGETFWAQMFADMTRIANLLVVKSLEVGYLVASVKIYGLLTEYKTGLCTPMAYSIDFENNSSKILVGIDMPFADCLASVSTILI